MRQFRWRSGGPIPPYADLRRLGWQLLEAPGAGGEATACPTLVQPEGLAFADWLKVVGATPAERKWFVVLDLVDADERARMLRLGLGDALARDVSLEELEHRLLRLIDSAQNLPRYRILGLLRLDLLARDAFLAGRALGLHPREFELLWRLSDCPGEPVSAPVLLRDVWRLSFRPETNSLAVHVSRLRARLRQAGVDGLIETLPDGSYRLIGAGRPALPLADSGKLALDAHLRLGKETAQVQTESRAEPRTDRRQDDIHAS